MDEAVTVRRATEDDAETVQRVARASWHAAYDSILGAETVTETVDSWFDPERIRTDDVRPDERPFFVAEVNGTVVSFVEAVPDEADDRTYHLYRIYVAPDHWGRGIGGSLLKRVEQVLKEDGVEKLRLSVLAENDVGVQFYESKGFDRDDAITDENFDVRRYEYSKELE